MSFGEALDLVRSGMKIAREGWNGKGMYLEFIRPTEENHLPYLRMKTADDMYVPWLASQTDVIADDWVVVE